MSPFLPVYKILLNEDNDKNPETTDTSLSGKDDMSHTSKYGFTEKTNIKKITDNDDNPETTDTSLSGKDDMSQSIKDDFTRGKNDKNITNHDEDYKEETSKRKEGNESVDNSETSDNLCGDCIILTTKNI